MKILLKYSIYFENHVCVQSSIESQDGYYYSNFVKYYITFPYLVFIGFNLIHLP